MISSKKELRRIRWAAVFLCLVLSEASLWAGEATTKAVAVAMKASDRLGSARYAVVIGINAYRDTTIPSLRFAESDAKAVYETLTDSRIGGIDPANAKLLLGQEATAVNIRKALNGLRAVSKDATVFIFFSGHGAWDVDDAFWVTYDAEKSDLASTAFPGRDVQVLVNGIPSNRLVLLVDCCYGAATVEGKKSIEDDSRFREAMKRSAGKGRVTITASGRREQAIEATDLKQGVFAHYLVEGMRGNADGMGGPADGIITIPELTAYIDKTVADAARQRRGVQTPEISMDGVQEPGKFWVTIDANRLAEIDAQRRQQTLEVQSRHAALKQMLIDDKISADQFALGKRLVAEVPKSLNEFDCERRDVFVELVDGKIPPNRLKTLLDAIETPEKRVARIEKLRLAAEEAAKKCRFDEMLASAKKIIDDEGFAKPPEGEIPEDKDVSARKVYRLLTLAEKLCPQNKDVAVLLECAKSWIDNASPLIPPSGGLGGSRYLVLLIRDCTGRLIDCGEGVWMDLAVIDYSELTGDPFYIGRYEVTQAQYVAVMGNNPSHFKGDGDLPVDSVSVEDAQLFCRRLSEKTGRQVVLPTELQWEDVCRAGTTTNFAYGDFLSVNRANFSEGSEGNVFRGMTMPVGSFKENAWDVHDMHGNVYEWCLACDPTGPTKPTGYVLKGGSWNSKAQDCRSTCRASSRSIPHEEIGFRVIVIPDNKQMMALYEMKSLRKRHRENTKVEFKYFQ